METLFTPGVLIRLLSLSVASLPKTTATFYPSCCQPTDSRAKALTNIKDVKDLTPRTPHIINSWVKPITTTAEPISNLSKPPVWELTTAIVSENWTHQSLMLMQSGAGWLSGTTAALRNMRETLARMLLWLNPLPLCLRAALMAPAVLYSNYFICFQLGGCDPKMCPRSVLIGLWTAAKNKQSNKMQLTI